MTLKTKLTPVEKLNNWLQDRVSITLPGALFMFALGLFAHVSLFFYGGVFLLGVLAALYIVKNKVADTFD